MQLNGSQIFVEVLCEQGVDTLFGYPGGAVLNLYDELYKNSDRITHVLTAHEQGAAHAADGYARATGRTGVVLATSGPGATNLVTGIATAYMDSVPMVAFTGNVTTDGIGRDSFQEAYIEGITMPITKHNFTVRRVEELADTMRSAFRIAQSGRKGPVLVDIPKDVTAAVCEFTPKKPEPIRTVTTFNAEQVKWAADLINAAQRPLVYFGGGVRSAASCQPLRDLLHKAEIPATYTLMAAGVVPYGDPMNIGMVGMHGCYTSNRAVADCDVLIAVGTRFSDRVALNPKTFAKNATIIQIDIDPSELGKNVEVDLSIVGDAAYVLNAMLPQIEEKKHPDWMKMIREWQAQDYHPVSDPTRLMPHQVIGEVCNQCGPEAVYVTDVGQHQMWAAQYLRHAKSRGFITSGGLGTMGFGYGAAIGAQMALGRDQRVVMFTGDGSFHMNLNEACTAVSYELPIITVIFNNSVLGMVRQWQTTFYEKRYSQTGMHGCYTSNRAVADCDVLIAVGTRFSDRVALNPKTFAKNATIIQIDIDPSELGKNVEVDLSIVGDAAYVLNAMLPQIEEKKHPDWMKMIREWQAQDYHPVSDPTRLMPHQVIGEVCNQCGPEAVYVTDVGQHQMWAAQYLRHAKSRGFITSGGLGTMGFGYGAAIGAQMALGRDQRVVMFTGDGSFHMNLNEACTAVSYELPIITVIFNNSVLGMVRQWQTTFYEKRYSQTDPHRKTDFVKLAEGFGLKGYRCTNLPEFQTAFADAMKQKGPTWIECIIDKDEKVLPMIPGGGDINDIIME